MNEIVHVDRGVEVIGNPVRISIGVDLPKDEPWYWVEFDCWGQGCGTLFLDLQKALDWCTVCYGRNLHSPLRIKDRDGIEVYGLFELRHYVMEHS